MRCSSRESRIAPSPRARGLPPSGSSRFTPPRHSRDAYAPAAVPFGSQRGGALCHAGSPSGRRGSGRVRFATDHPYVLTASCPSRMGTTAAITGFLAARRFYLIEMHQRSEEHTSELQSLTNLVCRLLLEKKKKKKKQTTKKS